MNSPSFYIACSLVALGVLTGFAILDRFTRISVFRKLYLSFPGVIVAFGVYGLLTRGGFGNALSVGLVCSGGPLWAPFSDTDHPTWMILQGWVPYVGRIESEIVSWLLWATLTATNLFMLLLSAWKQTVRAGLVSILGVILWFLFGLSVMKWIASSAV